MHFSCTKPPVCPLKVQCDPFERSSSIEGSLHNNAFVYIYNVNKSKIQFTFLIIGLAVDVVAVSSGSIGDSYLRLMPLPFSCNPSHSDSSAEVMEVDHDKQLVYCETLCVSSLAALSPGRLNGDASNSGATANLGLLGAAQPSDEQVAARLSAPVVTTQLDTRNIAFERSEAKI